jgi:hypothetical protein
LKPHRTLLKTPRRCRCEAQSRDLKVSIADAQIFGIDTGLFNASIFNGIAPQMGL